MASSAIVMAGKVKLAGMYQTVDAQLKDYRQYLLKDFAEEEFEEEILDLEEKQDGEEVEMEPNEAD